MEDFESSMQSFVMHTHLFIHIHIGKRRKCTIWGTSNSMHKSTKEDAGLRFSEWGEKRPPAKAFSSLTLITDTSGRLLLTLTAHIICWTSSITSKTKESKSSSHSFSGHKKAHSHCPVTQRWKLGRSYNDFIKKDYWKICFSSCFPYIVNYTIIYAIPLARNISSSPTLHFRALTILYILSPYQF